jgi:hypothetical protein
MALAMGTTQSTGRKPGGRLAQEVRGLAPAALIWGIRPADRVVHPRSWGDFIFVDLLR